MNNLHKIDNKTLILKNPTCDTGSSSPKNTTHFTIKVLAFLKMIINLHIFLFKIIISCISFGKRNKIKILSRIHVCIFIFP